MKSEDANLSRNYAMRLLRQIEKEPEALTHAKKFLKPAFFRVYLEHAESLVWHEPTKAVPFLTPAPEFAARLAAANPGKNGADYLIQGHSYFGNALRRVSRPDEAQEQFDLAKPYKSHASPEALAKYYRYYATLCIHQKRPEAFELLEKAIAIYKQGDLVQRHNLGECLVCRGVAYFEFNQPGKTLRDSTAALNHLSLQVAPISYYCALHNLATIAVRHGSDEDVAKAVVNLKAARTLLAGVSRHHYAKIGMRWLFGILSFRLGDDGDAEMKLLQVASSFRRLKLPFELGCVQLDLARLYLRQGKHERVRELVRETAQCFRGLGDNDRVSAALKLWREIFSKKISDQYLLSARDEFFEHKQAMAA